MLSLANQIRSARNPAERFACIARLSREWHGREPVGYAEHEIAAAADRLGIAVPPPVRHWVESFARTEGIAFGQNQVIPPAHWSLIEGRLTVGVENQGNWRAVVDLDDDDPPVHVVDWLEGALSACFSRYALQTALFESVLCGPGNACNGNTSSDPSGWLREAFGPPVIEPWLEAGPGPVTFYVGAPGIAFQQPDPSGLQWVFMSLVDDAQIWDQVERTAPIEEWVVAPTESG